MFLLCLTEYTGTISGMVDMAVVDLSYNQLHYLAEGTVQLGGHPYSLLLLNDNNINSVAVNAVSGRRFY